MCGIVGYIGTKDCGDILIDGLRRLEYRGYDSAGVAIHDGEQVIRMRAEGKLSALESVYRSNPPHGAVGIAHTRWATHGSPSERNAHPHMVDHIVLVHNGIIENYSELRDELSSVGAHIESDTDTELVAHLIRQESEKTDDLHAATRAALERLRGSYALVVMDARKPDSLIVARSASPLVLGLGNGEMFAASDVPAIMNHTRDVIFLEDGDTARLTRQSIEVFDESGEAVTRESKKILWDPVSAEKQGYKHFMLKEIHEQPARIVDTLRGRISADRKSVELPEVTLETDWVQNIDRIIITACGTSWHAGLVAKYAIEELARIPVEVDYASEYRYRGPIVTDRTLAIAISQSGETADTLAAIREAARLGAKTLTVCNVMESSLARECDSTIYTHAGPEIGVASTKAFTTQLAALTLLAIWLGNQRGTLSREREAHLIHELTRVPKQIEAALSFEENIRDFAQDFKDARGSLFLGRGMNFPIALEGALKLKEISYIHAEGYPAGEMKHGPIALIDEELPVLCVATSNSHYEKVVSNVEAVKARGGRLISVVTADNHDLDDLSEHVLRVPAIDEIVEPILTVVPLQLFSYAVADAKGTDIDQPRNLAKSVTVE